MTDTAVPARREDRIDTADEVGAPRRRSGRGRRVAVGAVAALAAAGAALSAVGFGGDGAGTTALDALPPKTATVTRQTLIDAETADGRLGYGSESSLSGRVGGTLTALPAVGTTVRRGQPLYRVDNRPVVLMYGTVPAYRSMSVGAEGPDVAQLERNLKALGYDDFTVDDTYTYATAAAVRQWQEDRGLPETGVVEHGRVVFLRAQVRVATHKAAVGDTVSPGQPVLTHTGTARLVTVKLDVDDQRLAKRGAKVTMTMPDGKSATGTVTSVTTVVETGDEGAETKVEVSVALADPAAGKGYDRAAVEVRFTASQRENVLTVPVAALLALAEGGYGVQVVENGATRIVAVDTGMFADGKVEVSGAALTEGMTVGMPA